MAGLQERRIDTAVVTGPTGAVGSALCRRLLDEGATVWAVVRPLCRRLDALPAHEKLHIVECDVSNLASLPEIMAETHIDALFHLAWAGTTGASRNDMPMQIDNIRYTIDAVRAAAALGASVFVGTGSQAEYGRAEGAAALCGGNRGVPDRRGDALHGDIQGNLPCGDGKDNPPGAGRHRLDCQPGKI